MPAHETDEKWRIESVYFMWFGDAGAEVQMAMGATALMATRNKEHTGREHF